jgi:phospholipid N-methyltransferase
MAIEVLSSGPIEPLLSDVMLEEARQWPLRHHEPARLRTNPLALNALRNLFGKSAPAPAANDRVSLVGPRIPRHSTGWAAMLKYLKEEESLRVLDIGPTSASNINLLTELGHSVCMSDLVIEANREEWAKQLAEETPPCEEFLEQNLNFGGRNFDVVLLWATLDYLPEALIVPVIARLYANLNSGGRILAFFHTRLADDERIFYRHHVTAMDNVEMQEARRLPLGRVYNNRNIERLFSVYHGCKFFLAKDNLAEVIVTR